MTQPLDISKLLVLRQVTTSIVERLTPELHRHLDALSPLLQPRSIFGTYVRSGVEQSVRGQREAYKQLQRLYKSLVETGKMGLPEDELRAPLEMDSESLEITPVEYSYTAGKGESGKAITVTPPLKWTLTYANFGLRRMQELRAKRTTSSVVELKRCVLQFLALHIGLTGETGVASILEALRLRVVTVNLPRFGQLPITQLESPVRTLLPADEVIIKSTVISGTPAFQEVVDIEGVVNLEDPLKQQLLEVIQGEGAELLTGPESTEAQPAKSKGRRRS